METKILPISTSSIECACEALMNNEVIGLPTETVYGLAANALNETAVSKIFKIKNRPADNPLIIHVSDLEMADSLCILTPLARTLFEKFSPGPLTLLLKKRPIVPSLVNANLDSVAIRIPSHATALALLNASDIPLAAPSANTSGKPSPTTAQHVYDDLAGKLPLILDGGPCTVGLESTVLDLTKDIPVLLRPGGVTPYMLLPYIPNLKLSPSLLSPLSPLESAPSPGMRYRHYAPKGKLTLIKGEDDNVIKVCKQYYHNAINNNQKTCILTFSEHIDSYSGCNIKVIGSKNNPESVALTLFDTLRSLDKENLEVIFCEVLPANGIGLAVMNRLQRAASFQLIDANTCV